MRDKQEATRRFAENLLRARRRAGLSQEAVARRAQISKGYVSRLEGGETECGIFIVIRLAGALGVEVDDLLDGIEWQPGENRTGAYGPSD
jgi:transcriptional regulator with XRE-family HTH domain